MHRARGGTSRRALPPLARAHVLQGPTDRTRGARGSPRPVQARPRKRHVGSHDEKAAFLTTREMTDRRVLLLEQAYQGRAMFVKVSCKAGESPVELSHHPELRFRFIPRPHDGAPLIANAVQFEVRLARTRAFSKRKGAFSFFTLQNAKEGPDASTNRRGPPPRLTHDKTRALLFHTRAPLVSFTRLVRRHHRRARRLSC